MNKETQILTQMERTLKRVHQSLNVNEELKTALRQELINHEQPETTIQRKNRPKHLQLWQYGLIASLLLGITIIALLWNSVYQAGSRVYAADLNLIPNFNTIQQLGKDPSTSAALVGKTLYVAVPDMGIYKQDTLNMELIVKHAHITSLRASPDGTSIGYTTSDGVFLYELDSGVVKTLYTQADTTFSSLSWSPDSKRVLFVKHMPSDDNQVWEVELSSRTAQVLVNGNHPSYTGGKDRVLYEKSNFIYTWDRSTEQSKLYMEGTQPVVSPDGIYVLYVREDKKSGAQRLWIADTDLKTEQLLDRNQTIPNREDWWWGDQTLYPDEQLHPKYTFDNISWGNDGRDILYYQADAHDPTRRQMVHLKLRDQKIQPKDVVVQMITALIYRDEALAHQYFSYNPGYLKGTSPRQVDYRVTNVLTETNGSTIVDADIMYSYSDVYYMVESTRFTLTKHAEQGHLIDSMSTISSTTIADWSNGDISTVENDQEGKTVLKQESIPREEGWKNASFAQILYDRNQGYKIWFLLNQESTEGRTSRMKLMRADLIDGSIKQFGALEAVQNADVLYVDEEYGYAAIVVSTIDGKDDIALISLKDTNEPVEWMRSKMTGIQPRNLTIRLLKNGELIFIGQYGERDVFFKYSL